MRKPSFLPLVFVLLAAGVAHAQDGAPLTRAQVVAELHAAQAAGAVPHGDLDISARNGGPDTAPARMAASTVTRAQVVAELRQAIETGQIQVGDSGRTLAEIDPAHYPLPVPQPGLTRAQVLSQLAEAKRVGDMAFGDSGKTMAEECPDCYAAARAEELREQQARYAAAQAPSRGVVAAASASATPAAAGRIVGR